MNTVKTEHRFSERVLAFFLVIMMFFTSMPESLFSVSAEDDEFQISIKWNHEMPDKDNYIYESDSPEIRDVHLEVSFSNKQVSEAYAPGELIITVPGIKKAVRSGNSYIASSVAADKEGSGSKIYNWSYSYTEATDTYTFTNNFTVEKQSVFEGTFEIMWTLPSRETIAEFEKTDMVAELFGDGFYTKSNAISYSQSRTKDEYSLTLDANPVFKDEMPSISGFPLKDEDGKEIEYVWVKYHVGGLLNYNSLGAKDSERFELYFAKNAGVFTTVTTANGEKNLIELKNDRTLETPEKDGCQLLVLSIPKFLR